METILIVDDTPANVFALEELLAREGRSFLTADNGKDALKLAFEKEIDLILLDVQMPGMDGFEVAQTLKSNKRTKDIPIIFATAIKKEHQYILKGFDEGAVDYLFKPLDPEITRAKVSVLLKIQLQKKELLEKNRQIDQLNRDLKDNVDRLNFINKELESFSYSVSHDLRAPLRAMDGYSRILEEDYSDLLDDEGRRVLKNIQYNAKRMGMLIDDLLEFSKMGRRDLFKSLVNMNDLVGHVILDGLNTSHHADIRINELLPVQGDSSLLRQVWINLISNAIKYSSKKDHPVIEINSSRQNSDVVYTVSDNGVGFDMAYADKLFGVFQRLHSNADFDGTGIGLATVQKIVSRHGGKVWADAKENEGATFSFSLPVMN